MFLTTRALVLREVKYKESDRMLTLLTEDSGKLTAKAQGALRVQSKLSAGTQLLAFSDFTFFNSSGRWAVREASPVELFPGMRSDIALLSLGGYIAELLEAVSDEDCPDPAVLQLGLNSLFALSRELCPQRQIKAAFELRLMCLSGYEPELSVCAGCGRRDVSEGALLAPHGELYCRDCMRPGMLPMGQGALAAMRHIIFAEPKKLFSFSLDGPSLAELGEVCEGYALCQLDRPFGSLDYYKRITDTL